jgi:hypothetical protein
MDTGDRTNRDLWVRVRDDDGQIKVLRMGEASSRSGGIQRAVTGAKCHLRAKQIVATKAAISLAFSRCVRCRGVYRIAATQPRCLPGSSFPGGWASPKTVRNGRL